MSTMIQSPTARTPQGGKRAGTITGAAQGAAAGTAVMPGIGTAVGAVVGAIGGFLGGSGVDRAKKHQALASKWAIIAKEREAAIARRNIIRDFRAKRAQAILMGGYEEGGLKSSTPRGGISSLGSQFAVGANFFDAQVYAQRQYQKHINKAGRNAARAGDVFATMGAVFNATSSVNWSSFGKSIDTTSGIGKQMTVFGNETIRSPQPFISPYPGEGLPPR